MVFREFSQCLYHVLKGANHFRQTRHDVGKERLTRACALHALVASVTPASRTVRSHALCLPSLSLSPTPRCRHVPLTNASHVSLTHAHGLIAVDTPAAGHHSIWLRGTSHVHHFKALK